MVPTTTACCGGPLSFRRERSSLLGESCFPARLVVPQRARQRLPAGPSPLTGSNCSGYACSVTRGEQIREAREAVGMTVVEFAHRVGVTERAVRLWEADDRTPGFDYMIRIARVTGKPVESFGEEVPGDAAADQAVHR